MKKVLKGVIFAIVGVFMLVSLGSCNPEEPHVHSTTKEWSRDSAQHWHVCDECGEDYDYTVHSYGSWSDFSDETATGRKRACSVCGFTQTQTIPVLYLPGTTFGWRHTDENKLTINGETASIEVTFEANAEFKITDNNWKNEIAFPADGIEGFEKLEGGNLKCNVAGTYIVKVTDLYGNRVLTIVTK